MAENKATSMANPPPLLTEDRLQEIIDSRIQNSESDRIARTTVFSVRTAINFGNCGRAIVVEVGGLVVFDLF